MPQLTIADARKVYERKAIPRTGYNRFRREILSELCEEKGVCVTSTAVRSSGPTKEDLIRALLSCNRKAQEGELNGGVRREDILTKVIPLQIMQGDSLYQQGTPEWINSDLMDISPEDVADPVSVASAPSGPPVRIRLYNKAKDWHYAREITFGRDGDGNVDLYKLKRELAIDGQIQVLEPHRRRPFFEYTPGVLHRDDLEDLMDDSFLRVVVVANSN